MLWQPFSFEIRLGSYICLYCLNFLQENWSIDLLYEVVSPEIALYLYKFTVRRCTKHYFVSLLVVLAAS